MSEGPPPVVAPGDADGRAEALTPERVEGVLADFRAWLREVAAPGAAPPDADAVDLHTLLAQFTALRHEVHLQTRASRAQQEQGAEALRQLGEAFGALQQSQLGARLGEDQARDEALRPLLNALVDVSDALPLAEREVRRTEDGTSPPPEPPFAPSAPVRPSFWARLFGLGRTMSDQQATITALRQQLAADRSRQVLASILTGYTMSLQRVE